MTNVLSPLGKGVLIPFGLTTTASARDAGIYKNYWFGNHNIDKFKRRNRRYHKNS